MFNQSKCVGKSLFVLFAAVCSTMLSGAGKVSATEITWRFHDMHGEAMGATGTIDPLNLLLPFLIMLIFGLAIWRVNESTRRIEQAEQEAKMQYSPSK